MLQEDTAGGRSPELREACYPSRVTGRRQGQGAEVEAAGGMAGR